MPVRFRRRALAEAAANRPLSRPRGFKESPRIALHLGHWGGVEQPAHLDPDQGAKIAEGTVGIRLPVSRFVCKRKLSQNKDQATRRQVIDALRKPGPYSHPALAEEMEQALDRDAPQRSLGR